MTSERLLARAAAALRASDLEGSARALETIDALLDDAPDERAAIACDGLRARRGLEAAGDATGAALALLVAAEARQGAGDDAGAQKILRATQRRLGEPPTPGPSRGWGSPERGWSRLIQLALQVRSDDATWRRALTLADSRSEAPAVLAIHGQDGSARMSASVRGTSGPGTSDAIRSSTRASRQ